MIHRGHLVRLIPIIFFTLVCISLVNESYVDNFDFMNHSANYRKVYFLFDLCMILG